MTIPKKPIRVVWGTVLMGALTLPLFAGCSESSTPATPDSSTGMGGQGGGAGVACDAPNLYFKKVGGDGCGASICHAAGDGFPDLTSGDADAIWSRLYDQPNHLSPTCADLKLISPQKPADGVILRRLKGMDCGPITMPKDGPFPAQAAIDCVTSWVNARLP